MWLVSVMNPAWLPVNESAGDAEVVQRHAQQRRRLALAGGDEHVHLPARAGCRDTSVGQAEQLVGLLAHGADDHDDLVAPAAGAGDVVGDLADALGVGDRRAAELLDEQRHGRERYRAAGPSQAVPSMLLAGVGQPTAAAVTGRRVRDLGALDQHAPGPKLGHAGGDVAADEGAERAEVVVAQRQDACR